jgi:hypothetical protein
MSLTDLVMCRVCQQPQPGSNFEVCRRIGDRVYRRKTCSTCKVAAQRARRAKLREWVDTFKKTHACVRCGFSDYRALQFHHRSDERTDFNIGDMVHLGYSIETIQAEIAKCYVLCANCHHIEHHCEMDEAAAAD